ncbi:MAG: hypothetical protein QM602_03295 [Microbacterium sp.]
MDELDFSGLNRRDASVGDPPPAARFLSAPEGRVSKDDPLRLCVYTTVAVIACLLGPIAVLGFAGVAIAGYARARRAGLLRSRCILGDTRNVLVYLWAIAVLAVAAIPFWVMLWASIWR